LKSERTEDKKITYPRLVKGVHSNNIWLQTGPNNGILVYAAPDNTHPLGYEYIYMEGLLIEPFMGKITLSN